MQNKHLLCKAGKATLIKAMTQAIPTNTILTIRTLDGACKDLDAFIRIFWWESKPRAYDAWISSYGITFVNKRTNKVSNFALSKI